MRQMPWNYFSWHGSYFTTMKVQLPYSIVSLLIAFSIVIGSSAQNTPKQFPLKQSTEIAFTENKGQVANQFNEYLTDVLFTGETAGLAYFLRKDGISYQFSRVESWKEASKVVGLDVKKTPDETVIHRTDINWIGTNSSFTIEKGKAKPGYNNYFLPVCPEGIYEVQSFESITYKNLYNGIDLKWYENNGALEYDFEVAPGADYKKISWEIKGALKLSVSKSGELVVKTPMGEIRENAPIAFQGEKNIAAKWVVNEQLISFQLADYDVSLPLTIDPIVLIRRWATYLGGSTDDYATSIATDTASIVYMAGRTNSSFNIATTGSHQQSIRGNTDAYLAKYDSIGQKVWATYYGGVFDDVALSCAVDSSSNVYMAGYAHSNSSIATSGSHQSTSGGFIDAFLAKFDKNGVRQWATYYGGNKDDYGSHCAIDLQSNVYLTGQTESFTDIATPGSHQSSNNGLGDAFLVKFDSSGVRQWATYYGSSAPDNGTTCAVDGSSAVYITGLTYDPDPNFTTAGCHQPNFGGRIDAYLVKFDNNGVRQWATYYGGNNSDEGYGCVVDASSNVYISGTTGSTNKIATAGSHQNSLKGTADGFLVKFNSNGVRQWGTYIGGDSADFVRKCAIDESSIIYTTGYTYSLESIATSNGFQNSFGGGDIDGLIMAFDSNGQRVWGSYYGGSAEDAVNACQINDEQTIYLAGSTNSTSGIATSGSNQSSYGGGNSDAFLVNLKLCNTTNTSISRSNCRSYTSPSQNFTWTVSGVYQDILQSKQGCDSIITIDLIIYPEVHKMIMNGSVLSINVAPATYQWMDCNKDSIISGATDQSYRATINGSYAVIVTQNGCTDTSDCFTINFAGLDKNGVNAKLIYYPNPTSGLLNIDLGVGADATSLVLRNIVGQKIIEKKINKKGVIVLDISDFKNGFYFLTLQSENHNVTFRVLKK